MTTVKRINHRCIICCIAEESVALVITNESPYVADYYCEVCREMLFEDSIEVEDVK